MMKVLMLQVQPQNETEFSRQEFSQLLTQIELNFNNVVETRIPNRLDRLPWCSWHTYIVLVSKYLPKMICSLSFYCLDFIHH